MGSNQSITFSPMTVFQFKRADPKSHGFSPRADILRIAKVLVAFKSLAEGDSVQKLYPTEGVSIFSSAGPATAPVDGPSRVTAEGPCRSRLDGTAGAPSN